MFLPAAAAGPELLYDYWHHLLYRPKGNCCCVSVGVLVLLNLLHKNSHSVPTENKIMLQKSSICISCVQTL
jgi:hypothetical protein